VTGALGLALLANACGGSGERPLRIGVIVDCQGAFRALQDPELAGAELPLIARGAALRGSEPSDGLRQARVAGRNVELVPGCSESGEMSTITEVARRLIERRHVDVVVEGGPYTVDGIALRDIARRYPDVPFVAAANGPREATLAGPPASVYRVAADYGQGVAGLATYAYRRLGWRRVALVVDDWVAGWGAETAFVREFCSLGGRVTSRLAFIGWLLPYDPARVPGNADGVAVLASPLLLLPEFFRGLVRREGDAKRRMVLGPDVTADPGLLRAGGRRLDGVVGTSYMPPLVGSPDLRAYLRQFARAFHGSYSSEARDPLVMNYRNAVEAVLLAFQRAHGDPSQGLRYQLGRLRTRLLGVPVRMDENRQAVVSTTLVRLGIRPPRQVPSLTAVKTIRGVDQSVGGLIPASYAPTEPGQACRRGPRPRWDR
jgi:branched-chain amino acid transport system substrate-binding protein